MLGPVGPILGQLEAILKPLGAILGPLRPLWDIGKPAMFGHFWPQKGDRAFGDPDLDLGLQNGVQG